MFKPVGSILAEVLKVDPSFAKLAVIILNNIDTKKSYNI